MPDDEGMQLSRHPIEMVGHFIACPIRLARRNGPMDRFVLDEGSLGAPWLGEKGSAHSFKMGADRVEHFADARQTQSLDHLPMEPGVEFVKTLEVSASDGRLLIRKILTEALDC